jgi:phage terminase large subunit GpA-like protein
VPSVIDWAPENLVLPNEESPIEGYFSFEYSPWMVEILRWAADPAVREITTMAPLQSGKTVWTSVWLYHMIRFAPGNTIVVMTDENTLKRRMKRLRATFRANQWLLERLGGRIENLHLGEATELPRMLLYLAWSNSAAAMASDPIPYVIADEVSLWAASVGNTDIHALHHLRGRQAAFPHTSKLFKISSPRNVGDEFDQEFEGGDKCEYWVPCHACSYWHILRWYDKEQPGCHAVLDRDEHGEWLPLKAYEEGRHVRYVCPSCGKVWSDYARAANLQQGRWLPAGATLGRAGVVAGTMEPTAYKSCRIRGLMVHPKLRSINRMAVQWVRGQMQLRSGRISGLKHFLNNVEGQSWREERADTDESRLRKHMGGYRLGTCPWGVQVLTISIDVHHDWFRVLVLGWGYLYECWLVEALRIETADTTEIEAYAPLRALVCRWWQLADGTWLPPSAVTIDAGYRPEPVKDFCRQNRHQVRRGNLLPTLGSSQKMNRLYSKVPIDAALVRYDLNTLELKDQLWRRLFEAAAPGPGYMHLPADLPGDVVAELCSEHKIVREGRPAWVPKLDGRDNHAWDCGAYGQFAAHLVGVVTLNPLATEPPPAREPVAAGPAAASKSTRKIRTHYD